MQIKSSIVSITSTHGTVHINEPVLAKNIVRFLCTVEVHIDGLDRNLYPAIEFNLADRANQFWIYPTVGDRDADCLTIADEVGPPPSDFLAYWDITGDGLPDTGASGKGPIAIFIGGVSGTHEADQLYFDETGIPTPLPVPYDSILEVRGEGTPFNIATFDAVNGSNLATSGNWTGPFAGSVAANMVGTIAHFNLMQFAKLTFAASQGFTYAAAIKILIKIKDRKGGLLSGNTGNILQLPIKLNQGTLNGCCDIDIRSGMIYCSMFVNAGGINQGLTTVKISDQWSKRNYNTQISDLGTFARTFRDTDSPTELSLMVFLVSSAVSPLVRTQITSFDADGMPVFGAPLDVNGLGAGRTGTTRLIINESLQSGEMPIVLYSKFNSFPVEVVANTGTTASPDYSLNLDMNAIDATLVNSYDGETAIDGRTYLVHGNPGNNFKATLVSRLTYSGPSTAIGYTTSGNWSVERIGTSAGTGAASSGDGLTFVGTMNGFTIDEAPSEIVNGEPTMYASDVQSNIIFKITRKATSFGDERDWDFLIIAGTGAAGNVNGIGILASFTNIRYLKMDGDFLYINTNIGGNAIRRMNVKTLQITTFIGIVGTSGIQPQFSY